MSELTVEQVMELAPVIPVLVVDRVEDALTIARALVAGGLPALEVTLRTPAALDVIREMSQVEGAVVGAGTVLNPDQLDAAMAAGARFVVSPGLTEPLGKAAIAANIPFLPGTATAGDIKDQDSDGNGAGTADIAAFIKAAKNGRVWDREPRLRTPK